MGFLSSIFGSKPKIPEFKEVDFDEQYDKTAEYNISNIDRSAGMSKRIQRIDQEMLSDAIRKAIPDYDEWLASESDITKRMLSGEMADEMKAKFTDADKARMRDRRAARGLASGQADSDYTDYQYARDLGITEYELSQQNRNLQLQLLGQGMSQLDNRLRRQRADIVSGPSVATWFQDPMQRINQKMSERDSRFQRDLAKAKADAAPDPVASGLFNVGMMAAGGAFGGGGLFGAAGGAAGGAGLGRLAGGLVGLAAGGPVGAMAGSFIGGGGLSGLFGGGAPSAEFLTSTTGYGAESVQGPSGFSRFPMQGGSGLAYSANPTF